MQGDQRAHRTRTLVRWLIGIGAVVVFLVAVHLLKSTVTALTPTLRSVLPRLIHDDLSALGSSWLAAYLLLNGSVVAAVALSLFHASLVTAPQLVLMIFGSRLGAAGIVLLIGIVDMLQYRTLTVRKASELGIIAFLVTHSVGLPAAVAGYAWVRFSPLGWVPVGTGGPVRHIHVPYLVEWMGREITAFGGPLLGLVVALGLLIVSLRVFSQLFDEADVKRLRTQWRHVFHRRWLALGAGLGVTILSTSIAFSLGVVVPIYNRGFLRRREVIPYILGANIGTLVDTLVISLFVERAGGMEVTVVVFGTTILMTVPALIGLQMYETMIRALLDRILARRRTFLLFLISLVLAPIGLISVGWVG